MKVRLCFALALLGGLTACGGGGGGGGTPAQPSPTPVSLTVGPSANTFVKIGQEQTYTATIRLSNGTENTATATWESDNTQVATIDSTGRARAVSSGEATLIARAQGLTGTLKIRVAPDYQGTWEGTYRVRSCQRSGSFTADWCDEGFPVGEVFPIMLNITQDRDGLSGSATLGQISGTLTGTIRIDGGTNANARITFEEQGFTFTALLDPIDVRAESNRMTGRLVITITAASVFGSVRIEADLDGVVRTGTTLAPFGLENPRVNDRRELFELLRRR